MLVCLLMAFLAWSLLDCHNHFTTQGPGAHSKPTKELGCQPGPRALGSEGISNFVHFGLLVLASRHSCLGTWQRSLKNRPNLPLEI